MTVATLPIDRFAVVTLGDAHAAEPRWRSLLAWPASGDVHVPLDDGTVGARNRWAVRLDRTVADADRAVMLVAEGDACFAVAWWARLSPAAYVARVAGALFVQPGDEGAARFASPAVALPFPSLVIGDPAAHDEDAARLSAIAASWGGTVSSPPATRAARWGAAQRMVERLSKRVVARDIALARLRGA